MGLLSTLARNSSYVKRMEVERDSLRLEIQEWKSKASDSVKEVKKFRRKVEIAAAEEEFRAGVSPHSVMIFDIKAAGTFAYLTRVFGELQSVQGDIVETGVFRGRSLLGFAYLAEFEGRKRRVWGFDSFEGFPEPTAEDESPRQAKAGQLAVSYEGVRQLFANHGFSAALDDSIRLVKGFFEDSLSEYSGDPIALLHIDADLYQSYKTVLERMYPLVVSGGIVVLDDYGSETNWPGAGRAVREYLGDKVSLIQKDLVFGKYYLVKP